MTVALGGPFDIGFTFPFYGNDFNEFRVCSNGFISVGSNGTGYTPVTSTFLIIYVDFT